MLNQVQNLTPPQTYCCIIKGDEKLEMGTNTTIDHYLLHVAKAHQYKQGQVHGLENLYYVIMSR